MLIVCPMQCTGIGQNAYRVGQLKWSQLTYSVILPIKMHKRRYYSTVLFYKKQVVIRKNIINAKANNQQNQTILL